MLVDRATGLWRDLVHAGRALARARGFTLLCVLSLGIGIAPAIAVPYVKRIFTAPPLGVETSGLVELITTLDGPRRPTDRWSYPDFIDLRNAATGASLFGWAMALTEVAQPSAPDAVTRAETMFVSRDYFETLGVALARGPGFGATTGPAVVLGDRFWQDQLGGEAGILNATLTLDGVPHAVVGIAPEHFEGHLAFSEADVYVPLDRHPQLLADATARTDRTAEWLHIHGRLAQGATAAGVSAAVTAITTGLARQHPGTNAGRTGVAEPYRSLGNLDTPELTVILTVWQVMALVPLLVVCLNLSGMVQVRSAIRERELSIRQAVGASRARLVQHLLAESVLLALAGGVLAAFVIFNAPPVMSWLVDEPIPARWQEALHVDASMIGICLGTCLAASLVFGWLPATRFSRPTIITVLKDDTGTGGTRVGRAQRITVALQVAIAVPLLVFSGMSLDRVRSTATMDLGFDAERLYAAPLPPDVVEDGLTGLRVRSVRDALGEAGGVDATALSDGLPLDFRGRTATVSVEAAAPDIPTTVRAQVTRVDAHFLDALRIPLLRGRGFAEADGPGSEPVAVIARSLADGLFPDVDPAEAIGRRLTFTRPGDDAPRPALTIVGITADFPTSQMSTERAQLLLPLAQHADLLGDAVPITSDRSTAPIILVVARASADATPAGMAAVLENVMRQVDEDFTAADVITGTGLRDYSVSDFLTQSMVSGLGGGLILLLTALGLYGVVGMMVTTRTREIAVRMTLGASRGRVIGLVVRDVVTLVAPGIAVGLLIAAVLVHIDGGILGLPLSHVEWLAYVAGAAIALAIAVLASLFPARRAASVQPLLAMRAL